MKARNLPVSNGCISVVHEGSNPVRMTKNEHIADVFACKDVAVENLQTPESIQKIYDLGREDLSHLYQAKDIDGENSSYLEEILLILTMFLHQIGEIDLPPFARTFQTLLHPCLVNITVTMVVLITQLTSAIPLLLPLEPTSQNTPMKCCK